MSRKTVELTGILAAVTTPFTADGSAVDEAALTAQAEHLIESGIHGIVPCGTSGEFYALSPQEYRRVMELYIEAADGRIPVVIGIGSTSTQVAVELAQHAEKAGADALMVVPPYYDPLDYRALTQFLTDISDATNLTILYYNVPGATGISLTAEEVAGLGDIDGVDYLKDTSGDAVAFTDLVVNRSEKIKAFNGYDTLTFLGLSLGAEASVWGVGGLLPKECVALWDAMAAGDLPRARELWQGLWAVSDVLESVNYVAGLKAGLEMLGRPVGPARKPVLPLTDEDAQRLREAIAKVAA